MTETKLHPPRARTGTLRRARLHETLDNHSATALTLVAAPAGYGKTILLTSWCAEQKSPVVWVTLDTGDDDPARLWTHLAAATSRARRGLGGSALERLSSPGVGVEPAIESLLEAIRGYGEPVVVVFDELDSVRGEESLRTIESAIERLPANTRLLAATRADPAIGLPRLRARHMLAELRARELAFTREEAHELLIHTEQLPLSTESLDLLVERTEGWPAALYLAALWLRDHPDPDEATRHFGASNRQVGDYLSEELLGSLDEDTRAFLVRTASLGQFTPELCDAVLERSDSRAVLSELERSNLLLVGLDDGGVWYRYHRLFEELLLLEGGRLPERPEMFHRRASDWLRDRGHVEDAIAHAEKAGDLELVAEILTDAQRELLWGGRTQFFQSWVERLPVEVLMDHPSLPAAGALSAVIRGRPSIEIERLFVLAARARSERPDAWTPDAETAFGLVRSLAIEGDDAGARVEHARTALESARVTNHALLVGTLANLALALLFTGDLEESGQAAHEAATREDAEDRPNGYVVGLGCLAAIDAERGRPEHASAWARKALDYARSRGIHETWFAAPAHLALAGALVQTGQLADAEREARRGERLWQKSQASPGHAYALIRLAEVRAARSRTRGARTALDAAKREIAEFADPGRLPALAKAVEAKLAAAPTTESGLVESPSPGELAVLRYLPTDLTHREIAAHLFISLNTVRTHIRALYHKLNVGSREEAVARAEALGLLDGNESPR